MTKRLLSGVVAIAIVFATFAGLWNGGQTDAFTGPPDLSAFQSSSPVASPEASPAASPIASPEASPVAAPSTQAHQVFLSGRWLISIAAAARSGQFDELNLSPRSDRDWIIVVADVTNFSSKRASFDSKDFGVRVDGSTDTSGLSQTLSEAAAKTLGFGQTNMDNAIRLDPDQTARVVLVLRIDHSATNPALTYGADALPLATSFAQAVSFATPPATQPAPATHSDSVKTVVDGNTVKLKSGATVKLADLDAPSASECYGTQAIARIKKLTSGNVLVTVDPTDSSHVYVWIVASDGSRDLLNQQLILGGYSALKAEASDSYAEWLGDSEQIAKNKLTGLWGACTSQHGVARPQGQDRTALTLTSDGAKRPYAVWVSWSPLIITTPDGGAWAFFSAAPTTGSDKGNNRLYSSRFDPTTGNWSSAKVMSGGLVEMGPSAVVDANGTVHLVYTDRAKDADGVFSVLMYTHDDKNGNWAKPISVAPDAAAGYQLSPSLAIDRNGVLHVAWQDQRLFDAAAIQSSAANADILESSMKPGGTWSQPIVVNQHFSDAVASRPHLVADGDRLVCIWSVYAASLGISSAAQIAWSSRPVDGNTAWAPQQPVVVGRGEKFGGRLLDVAADPTGGVVLVYGRQGTTDTFLFMQRLEQDSNTWGADTLITFGNAGTYPSVTVSNTGTVYVVYNYGSGQVVDVGAVANGYHSISPGPEVVLTKDQPNGQGRPIVTTDVTGHPWIIYFSEPGNGVANEVDVIRNANIPTAA